jgi:hypothetical protein
MDKQKVIKHKDSRSNNGRTGVMPIPLAITIILSKLVAELKGDRNGPYTHPGRELGVLRMACNSLVQLPAVAMHTDE